MHILTGTAYSLCRVCLLVVFDVLIVQENNLSVAVFILENLADELNNALKFLSLVCLDV